MRVSYTVKLARPDDHKVVVRDFDKPDQPSVIVNDSGVKIHWGCGEVSTFYPMHRVISVECAGCQCDCGDHD